MQASVVVFSWQPPVDLNVKLHQKKDTAARQSSDKELDKKLENSATISSVDKQKSSIGE